jgi:hypothetical protein
MLPARHSSTQVCSVITITGLGDHDDRNPQYALTAVIRRGKRTPLEG